MNNELTEEQKQEIAREYLSKQMRDLNLSRRKYFTDEEKRLANNAKARRWYEKQKSKEQNNET